MNLILQMVFTALGVLVVMMAILWWVGIKIKNAAVVDVGWGGGFVLLALVYFFLGDGFFDRRLLMAGMVIVWGGRLALHLFVDRILSGKPEDGRYVVIRNNWKTKINLKLFFFYEFQALLIVILSLPFLFMALNLDERLTWVEWLGFAIWGIGIIGESVADAQLRRFKSDPANQGKVCQLGLWNYSRHPNYFLEWVIWVGYCVASLASPYGWASFNSALIMAYILTRVTGIPMTEEQALRTKGDAYRAYQRTTSSFIPWFKRADQ